MRRTERGRDSHRRGLAAESRCVWYLRLHGYRIVAVRFKTPVGEVDIIARRGRTLAFVEVKSRPGKTEAAYAITPKAQARIERASAYFLAIRPEFAQHNLRLDAMFVTPLAVMPTHLKDAWHDRDSARR